MFNYKQLTNVYIFDQHKTRHIINHVFADQRSNQCLGIYRIFLVLLFLLILHDSCRHQRRKTLKAI